MSILDITDDFELCNRLWCALSEKAINADDCGELERVVRLIWDSAGLIENGGFRRFFEGDYPGDPGFIYTIAAYKRIGANAAYKALQVAFSQFPGGLLPANIHERLRIFDLVPEKTWNEIEGDYYDATKETERCLAQFIRDHRNEYERLLATRQPGSDGLLNGGPVADGNSGLAGGSPSMR